MTIALEHATGTAEETALVPSQVRERLAKYIARHHSDIDLPFAERIVVAAAQFQDACAQNPGVPLAPSKVVDIGWHAWLMHTRDNLRLSARIGGAVHHVPTEAAASREGDAKAVRQRTLDALTRAGHTVDPEMWPSNAMTGDCSQCHAGCTDSPVGK
ncbi:glycine-rich domain-containing protein [Streptomyces sp. NPDC058655]|uniref:glycine-rich domain-containing protein n=1 Tax=Streptomyces sp. NPDC058655 TaxID=3346577 RepID=UPI0036649A90